jgi:integrase
VSPGRERHGFQCEQFWADAALEGIALERTEPARSLLLAQRVPLEVVSETLGHSSIRATKDVYGHLMAPWRALAADAMQQTLW